MAIPKMFDFDSEEEPKGLGVEIQPSPPSENGWIPLGFTVPNCDERCTYQEIPCSRRRCYARREDKSPHTHRELVHISDEEGHADGSIIVYGESYE